MPLDDTSRRTGQKKQRDAFLYLDPRTPDKRFAQCGTCRLFLPGRELCGIIGNHAVASDSCGFYGHGKPTDDQPVTKSVTAKEAGFVRRQVRCENCKHFHDGHLCGLFETLNKVMPDEWDLDPEVDKYGCCNAQSPRRVRAQDGGTISLPANNFADATEALSLTPQEQYLYQHHLQNLYGPGKVIQPDGSVSTMLQANVAGPDGRSYNIPTVWYGRELPVPMARALAARAGWNNWPSYPDAGEAERRYADMHEFMEGDTAAVGHADGGRVRLQGGGPGDDDDEVLPPGTALPAAPAFTPPRPDVNPFAHLLEEPKPAVAPSEAAVAPIPPPDAELARLRGRDNPFAHLLDEPTAPARPPPTAEPGWFGTAGQAAWAGAKHAFGELAEAPTAFRDRPPEPPDESYIGHLVNTPIEQGWSNPKWWIAQGGYFAGGMAPAAAATLVGGLVGGPVGAVVGGAGEMMLQAIGPAYQRARADHLDHDAAVERAIKETLETGAFGAVMGGVAHIPFFGRIPIGTDAEGNVIKALKHPIGEALVQLGFAQPAVMVGQDAATAYTEGRTPSASEIAQTYATGVTGGGLLYGAHRLGERLARGAVERMVGQPPAAAAEPSPAPPAPPEVPPEQRPDTLTVAPGGPTPLDPTMLRQMLGTDENVGQVLGEWERQGMITAPDAAGNRYWTGRLPSRVAGEAAEPARAEEITDEQAREKLVDDAAQHVEQRAGDMDQQVDDLFRAPPDEAGARAQAIAGNMEGEPTTQSETPAAVPPPSAPPGTETPAVAPQPAGFRTAQGSTYDINEHGQTSRTKRSPGRGQGTTYDPHNVLYVSDDVVNQLVGTPTTERVRIGYELGGYFHPWVEGPGHIPEGARPVVVHFDDRDNITAVYPAQVTPEVGLHPIEKRYFTPAGETQLHSSTHIGNQITEIFPRAAAEPA
ncbi:MAG: hypothetical protein C5B60_01285, partial [Chloroflexi bacterium]